MTTSYPMPIPPDEALGLPVDRLALRLLRVFGPGNAKQHRHNFLLGATQNYQQNGVANHREVTKALAEAFDWLLLRGLFSGIPGEGDWLFITRKGRSVLEASNGLALVQAEARIDVDLHPSIADRVRSQFLLGEYELAAFAALRQVEIRVRELAGAGGKDDENFGVKLMTRAFKEGGPLRDTSAEGGEQVAMMNLFQGAIGVFKNPPSHRQVDYDDPTLASEVVLLADLLLRLLDARAKSMES